MLRLRIDPDGCWCGTTQLLRQRQPLLLDCLHQRQNLLQRRDLELSVEAFVGRADVGNALASAQRLQLGEREVLREPTRDRSAVDDLCRTPGGKLRMRSDVGRRPDLILVTRHQHAVLRHHQVRLDEVDTILHRDEIGRQGMFGDVTARAAVANDDGHCRILAHCVTDIVYPNRRGDVRAAYGRVVHTA